MDSVVSVGVWTGSCAIIQTERQLFGFKSVDEDGEEAKGGGEGGESTCAHLCLAGELLVGSSYLRASEAGASLAWPWSCRRKLHAPVLLAEGKVLTGLCSARLNDRFSC